MLIKRFLPKHLSKKLSLREFYEKRNNVLIVRNARGLGDIFMHRMIFEDFKKIMPEAKLTFACPVPYHEAVKGHPFLDEVVDSVTVDRTQFLVSYDTSRCCIEWECAHAPFANKNRADIWAEHCGVKLTTHNMHLPFIDTETVIFGKYQVKQARSMSVRKYKGPSVLLAPMSHEPLRTLADSQIEGVVKYLREKDCFVYSTHVTKVPTLEKLEVPTFTKYPMHKWLSFIHAADYVVSVDTAVFHYAGGINKPLTGIFTHADGKYRGQYYDFTLVQKHRDNGNWPCGPCYNYGMCTHPKLQPGRDIDPKPCLTELTVKEIAEGIDKMFERHKWDN